MKEFCPICGIGTLTEMEGINNVDIDGVLTSVSYYYSLCDHCNVEIANSDQLKRNKEELQA